MSTAKQERHTGENNTKAIIISFVDFYVSNV